MKTYKLLLSFCLLVGAAQVHAVVTIQPDAVPGSFNFQGRLEDAGTPVQGTRSIVFNLYDALTSGNLLDSNTVSVTVTQGLFNASVTFSTTALAASGQKYLELVVAGTTLSPREPLQSVPYAQVAKYVESKSTMTVHKIIFADGSAQTAAGVGSANSLSVNTDAAITADADANGSGSVILNTGSNERMRIVNSGLVGVGTSSPTSLLHVAGNMAVASSMSVSGTGLSGTTPIFEVKPATLSVLANGNVGIGTASPASNLHVMGSVRLANFTSCDTIDTDANGVLSCGTDATSSGGGSSSQWETVSDNVRLVTSTQSVAIGTTSPSAKLHVVHSTTPLLVSTSATSGIAGLYVNSSNRVGIGTTNPGYKLSVIGGGTSPLYISSDTTTTGLMVDASNNYVGIGTNSPSFKLDVRGSGNPNEYVVNFSTSGISKGFRIDFGNRIRIGAAPSGAGGPKVLISADERSPQPLKVSTSAVSEDDVSALLVDSQNRVGIGTNSPSAKLDVNGDAIVRSTLTVTAVSSVTVNSDQTALSVVNSGTGPAAVFSGNVSIATITPQSANLTVYKTSENSTLWVQGVDASTRTVFLSESDSRGGYIKYNGLNNVVSVGSVDDNNAIVDAIRIPRGSGDAAIPNQGSGLILKATDGASCYRLTVNNAGTLSTASVTCP